MTGSRLTAGIFSVLALLVCLGVNTNANAARPTGEIPEREFRPAKSNDMVLRVQKAFAKLGLDPATLLQEDEDLSAAMDAAMTMLY